MADHHVPGLETPTPMTTNDVAHVGTDVLFVMASFQAGGAEKVITTLANRLSDHRSVTLMVIDPNGPLREQILPRVQVVALDRKRARRAALAILRAVRRDRPRTVMSSQTHINILLSIMLPFMPRPTQLIVREAAHRPDASIAATSTRIAQRTAYRNVALVIASSSVMADDLRQRVRSPVEVLHNPVDEDALRQFATPPLRLPGPGRRFIHLGRFAAGKGAPEAVRAFAHMAAPDDHLTMIGDGPELELAVAAAREQGLTAQVTFHGFLNDPTRHLAGSDLLVLPSHREGMPNVALEALALGTPILATQDLTTLSDLVASTTPGSVRLVPRDGLAAAMAATIADPPTNAVPRVSLLPSRHRLEGVTHRLLELINGRPSQGTM